MILPFVAAAEQATRYGRQLGKIYSSQAHQYFNIWSAWTAFVNQFDGNVREVLMRTFWQAYYS